MISFAGGYGGLVIAENGQLTLAGCIRRDALKACRAAAPGRTAGEAFERYLRTGTRRVARCPCRALGVKARGLALDRSSQASVSRGIERMGGS